ncbi:MULTISPECIES: hypothetical protein [unclassified Roseitalea]|uniref:hypothetical protein n=1 Tax=unclassified Roseitalea TaxID=2639107 RepID=UPI00274016AF|nr:MULTISPECIES: hypothetical protein [unclassified Roseitalea]
MRAIEAIADSRPVRWVRSWRERQVEVAFGAGLMLVVVLGFAAGEMLARVHHANAIAGRDFDWMSVMVQMEREDPAGPMRFPRGSNVDGLRFNALGLRGPDVPRPKPDDTVRLAFVGDSKLVNGEFAEQEMIAARTAALLQAGHRTCRFDHVTVAGPAYTIEDLAYLIDTEVGALEADIYIVLVGATRDALTVHARDARDGGYMAQYPFLGHYSVLWDKLSRAFHLRRQARFAAQRGPLPKLEGDRIATALDAPLARLDAAMGDAPVLAVGYRGRMRAGQSDAELARSTRQIRMETRKLGARDFVALNAAIVNAQRRAAARHGWAFADPIMTIAGTEENFIDSAHFSRKGIALFSRELAGLLAPMLPQTDASCLAVGR